MAGRDVKLHISDKRQLLAVRERSRRRLFAASWIAVTSGVGMAGFLQAGPTHAQPSDRVPCADTGQKLIQIPEIQSKDGKLSGTIILSNEIQRMDLLHRAPPAPPCRTQDVRLFRGVRAVLPHYPGDIPSGYPNYDPLKPGEFRDPVPGPTLRARVGDIVQLTFLNHIKTSGFWKTLDRGERARPGEGCDENASAPYPGPDEHPNCFHGSSTGNIHFHGTHTNPSTTGDNIFVEVRPSIRGSDDKPIITEANVKEPFAKFFADCEAELTKSLLSQWPRTWNDLPRTWTKRQEALLRQYDSGVTNKLWSVNARQIKAGAWPQYHIGAFPFCFRLPKYTEQTQPPAQAAHPAVHIGPISDEERTLRMGQVPGIHWYHAHKHGSTAINVSNGMTGAFIIEGDYDDDLNRFYGTIDVPAPPGSPNPTVKVPWTRAQPVLVINQLGTVPIVYASGSNDGPRQMPLSVNGRMQPKLSMRPGEVQLWRIVNTSSRSGVFFLGFSANDTPDPNSAGFKWKQLAQDGVQFAPENFDATKNINPHFLLAAGNRADVLVKAPENQSGTFNLLVRDVVRVTEKYGQKPSLPPPRRVARLLKVQIESSPTVSGRQSEFISGPDYPKFPSFLADIKPEDVKATKTITFETTPPKDWPFDPSRPFHMHMIDGKKFAGNVGQVVPLDAIEEWKIENRSTRSPGSQDIDHPFHIHINPFQVVEEFAPNEPLVHPETGKPLIDPDSDPVPEKRQPYPKYVFDQPARTIDGAKQCSVNTRDPTTWKPCDDKWQAPNRIWWDVFPIPAGKKVNNFVIPGYFKMRSRFVDYSGQFVIHCHILAHEDRGMMTIVWVVPLKTPYSHQ